MADERRLSEARAERQAALMRTLIEPIPYDPDYEVVVRDGERVVVPREERRQNEASAFVPYRDRSGRYWQRVADLFEFIGERYGVGYEFSVRELREDIGGDWTSPELTAKLRQMRKDLIAYNTGDGAWGLDYE